MGGPVYAHTHTALHLHTHTHTHTHRSTHTHTHTHSVFVSNLTPGYLTDPLHLGVTVEGGGKEGLGRGVSKQEEEQAPERSSRRLWRRNRQKSPPDELWDPLMVAG